MQVTTNEIFIRRRGTIGWVTSVLGFAILAVGAYIALQQTQAANQQTVTWIAFIPWITFGIGFILTNVGKYYTMRYGGRPRIDLALAQSLKGLDSRNHLYNYVPTIPAEHVLVTPNAVVIIETRPFFGEIIHRKSKWTRPMSLRGLWDRFSDGGLGNPTEEAQRDSGAVTALLSERLGEDVMRSIVVLPIIVCTSSRIKLQLDEPDVPVVMIGDLRGSIRRLREGSRLNADLQRQIIRALQWGPQADADKSATTRGNTWQRTQK